MFNQARLKLTLWYLLIIMSISVSFSFFIYQLLQNEIRRIALIQEERLNREVTPIVPGGSPARLIFDQEIIDESRKRLLYSLLMVNGAILVVSGGLAYLLAGETLKPIQDMVEDQNRFISDASHELRTPLTALKSTMEVNIRDKNLTIAEARTLISESIEEVDKLHKLSEDLLQLARSKHTATAPIFTTVETNKIIAQAIRKVAPIAAKKKIKVRPEGKTAMVEGQAESLIQALVIVLDNAIKYSPPQSQILVSSKIARDTVEISVIDHGVGIARKDVGHIFDRFYRTDNARSKSDAGGYGLGLSIAQQIITTHQGNIKVKSQPNKGTTLTFILPLTSHA